MIKIDTKAYTYTCPYCGCRQSYWNSHINTENISEHDYFYSALRNNVKDNVKYNILTIICTNTSCKMPTIIAIDDKNRIQVDILPQHVYRHFPEYIPEQIRKDYCEAAQIIELSPKAAATLLRRCLQGMIRDFWDIDKNKLNDAINELHERITASQWNAIDGLRKLGNIGAHMEKDVDLIIEIAPDEAKQLLKLIELLLEKWYIARHDEEELCQCIKTTSDSKQEERKQSQ